MDATVKIVVKFLPAQEAYGVLHGKSAAGRHRQVMAGSGCKGEPHRSQGGGEGIPEQRSWGCISPVPGGGSVWVGCRSSAEAALGAEAEQSNSGGLGVQAKERTVGRGHWHCVPGLLSCSQDTGFHSGCLENSGRSRDVI